MAKWPTPPGGTDALASAANRKRLEELLEESFNSISMPARYGDHGATLGQNTAKDLPGMHNDDFQGGGTGKHNCCSWNCGPDTPYGGYPVMWDQAAVQPLDLAKYKFERTNGARKVGNAWITYPTMSTRAFYLAWWKAGITDYPAACPIPPEGLPEHSHLVRVSPCYGEWENVGVFCALVKITTGDDPVVQAWGEMHGDVGVWSGARHRMKARYKTMRNMVHSADTVIRKAVLALRYELAQPILEKIASRPASALSSSDVSRA